MAVEIVNLGNAANDGLGDDLRTAFSKINNSLTYLQGIAEQTGANLGTTGAEVFALQENNVFYFRRLLAGTNISITENNNTIEIANTQPASTFSILGDSGGLIGGAGIALNIVGGNMISTAMSDNDKTITITGAVSGDPNPVLGGSLNASGYDITGANQINGNTSFVTNVNLTNINNIDFDSRLGRYLDGLDMGALLQPINSILDYVLAQTIIDFGTFENPASEVIDLGTL
jgi:hypothetical protein